MPRFAAPAGDGDTPEIDAGARGVGAIPDRHAARGGHFDRHGLRRSLGHFATALALTVHPHQSTRELGIHALLRAERRHGPR